MKKDARKAFKVLFSKGYLYINEIGKLVCLNVKARDGCARCDAQDTCAVFSKYHVPEEDIIKYIEKLKVMNPELFI